MATTLGSLLKETDLTREQFLALVELASKLKHERSIGIERHVMAGKHIVLVFEKNSTRTRCAFETAAGEIGGRITYLGPDGSHVGREESAADTARVLGRLYDGIAYRGFDQTTIEDVAEHAGVPVWNALSDQWHPTQMLADVLTLTEYCDPQPENIAVCYSGDGRNNVARSLLVTGALLGMDVRIAAPAELQPPADVQALAGRLAERSGARWPVTDDVRAAVDGAAAIYTDVWLSMGESPQAWADRIALLRPYRVTRELLAATGRPDTVFLHCLPSLHDRRTTLGADLAARFDLGGGDGVEVTDEVFESGASVVFDQAENRMHTIKSLLISALGR